MAPPLANCLAFLPDPLRPLSSFAGIAAAAGVPALARFLLLRYPVTLQYFDGKVLLWLHMHMQGTGF